MRLEVERGSVCEAHALHPSVGALDLRVPAVGRVVRHLVLQVLPEAQARRVDAQAVQEEEGAADEVAQRLVVDDALAYGGEGGCVGGWVEWGRMVGKRRREC